MVRDSVHTLKRRGIYIVRINGVCPRRSQNPMAKKTSKKAKKGKR